MLEREVSTSTTHSTPEIHITIYIKNYNGTPPQVILDRETGELVGIIGFDCSNVDPETPVPKVTLLPDPSPGFFSDEFDIRIGGFFIANTGFDYCNPTLRVYDRDKEEYIDVQATITVSLGGRITGISLLNNGTGFRRIPDVEIFDNECPGFGAEVYPIMQPFPLPDGKPVPISQQVFCPTTKCFY